MDAEVIQNVEMNQRKNVVGRDPGSLWPKAELTSKVVQVAHGRVWLSLNMPEKEISAPRSQG